MHQKHIWIIPLALTLLIIVLVCISRSTHSHDTSPTSKSAIASSASTPMYTAQPTNSPSTKESSSTTELRIISPSEHATPDPTISPTPKPVTDIKDSPNIHTSSSPSAKTTVKATSNPTTYPTSASTPSAVHTTPKPTATPTAAPTAKPTPTTEKVWIVDVPGHYETVTETTEVWIEEQGHWEDIGYWTSDWVYQCNGCKVTFTSSNAVNDHIWTQFDKDPETTCASYTQVSGESYWVNEDPVWIADTPGHYETQTIEKQIWVEEQGHWETITTE